MMPVKYISLILPSVFFIITNLNSQYCYVPLTFVPPFPFISLTLPVTLKFELFCFRVLHVNRRLNASYRIVRLISSDLHYVYCLDFAPLYSEAPSTVPVCYCQDSQVTIYTLMCFSARHLELAAVNLTRRQTADQLLNLQCGK